jgi:hypothetical protein
MKKTTEDKALKKELAQLKTCYNKARSQLAFHKELRTKKSLLHFFGVESDDTTAITIEDVDKFYEEAVTRIQTNWSDQLKGDREEHTKSSEPSEASKEAVEEGQESDTFTDEYASTRDFISSYQVKYPNQEATLLTQKEGGCNQVRAAQQLWDNINHRGHKANLLLAQTGAGKTYILGSFIKNFIEQGLINTLFCYAPNPIFYVTKSSVVEQTKKALRDEFGVDVATKVRVVNIEYLRTQIGSNYVKREVQVILGQEHEVFVWNEWMMPCLIVWDECQILAREDSTQSKIAQAVNNVTKRVIQIFASATPFSRVAEAKCFAVATGVSFHLGLGEVTISNENWKSFACNVAAPADPYEYVEAAVKRLTDKLEPYIVRIKGIKPKHRALNSVQRIYFKTPEEKKAYDDAWEEFQKKKAKIESDESISGSQAAFMLLAELTVFAKKAEFIRVPYLVDWVVQMWNEGYAPVLAVRFKQTQTAVYQKLVTEHGWTRDDVSMIWGGSTEAMSDKKKLAKKVKENAAFIETMKQMGIDIKEDLGVDIEDINEKTNEQIAFERAHNLLSQKPEERERERMRFQTQRSKLCIFNFKSGGVGLSLHHEAKHPNARQRVVLLTPVYSEKELVQALGRCPRITSISDTNQTMVYYANTIEEHVAARVVMKLKCLKQVVKARESWEAIITGKPVIEEEDDSDETLMLDAADAVEGNQLMEYVERN